MTYTLHDLVPREVSPRVARVLCANACSARHLRNLVEAGLLAATGRIHKRISVASLEAWHGRPFTLDDWARAHPNRRKTIQ